MSTETMSDTFNVSPLSDVLIYTVSLGYGEIESQALTRFERNRERLHAMSTETMSDTFNASKKISDEIKADLAVHPEKYTMLTGDRPTGRLHMGHYFGTIRERVKLQNAGITTRIIIADYQVITDRDTTEHIADNVHNMVIDYLACGIDPEKTIIFTHSAVPALNQLMLPFLSLCTEAELMRNPTVKAEQEASGHALTGLLLTYPVHQACDILFCKGNIVPVGKDQLPHIEQTRQIARRFNERYGHVFPEPHGLLTDAILFCKGNIVPVGKDQLPHIEQTRQIARRFNERYGHVFPEPHGLLTDAVEIPGLDGRKMSKSYGNSIALSATAEETAKLIKKSKTDSERFITFDKEGRPGVSALLTTAALCTGRTEVEIAEEIGNDGSGALKKYVTEAVNNYLAPIRARRAELEGDMDYIRDVLAGGNRRANEIADQTLGEVREAMGMVY